MPHNCFLGYGQGEHGELAIDAEEAVTVRHIYRWFLDGYSPQHIAKLLEQSGIRTGRGGEKWYESTVRGILQNGRRNRMKRCRRRCWIFGMSGQNMRCRNCMCAT